MWASTLITLKTFLKKEIPGNKGSLSTRSIYLLCLHLSLCFIYYTLFAVFAPSSISIYIYTIYGLFLNRKPHPSSIPTPPVGACHPPPPLLLLDSCRPLSWSLNLDTLLEMASCVVTETIWSRRSFTIPPLPIDPPPHRTAMNISPSRKPTEGVDEKIRKIPRKNVFVRINQVCVACTLYIVYRYFYSTNTSTPTTATVRPGSFYATDCREILSILIW